MIYALTSPKYLGRTIQLRDTPDEVLDMAKPGDRIFKLMDNMKKQSTKVICDLIDCKANNGDYLSI